VKTTVLLIEDHALVRAGVRALLDDSNEVTVVGEAGDGHQALDLCREHKPNIAITDIEMRGLNGIETARQIHETYQATKIIMLSMYGDSNYVFEAVRAGASGFVLKESAFSELMEAIRAVISGRRYFSPALSDVMIDDYAKRAKGELPASDLDKLSNREREVLQLIAEGKSSKQVASVLFLSARTVETHRFNLMRKLGIDSIAGLTKFAIAHGLTSAR
jgi:DNA-binding NarL/FixJ family response regulator